MVVVGNAATISFVDIYSSAFYNQTSAAAPALAGYSLSSRLYMPSAGAFTAANMTLPGGGQPPNGTNGGANPDMTLLNSTTFGYTSPLLSASAFASEFPTGTYTFTATDAPDQTVSVNRPSPNYSSAIPTITDFTSLQGLNTASPFTVTFNSFTNANSGTTCNNTNPTCSFIFFDVYNAAGTDVFSQGFLPSSTTSVTIPANTLLPNTSYRAELIYSNRQLGT
jgi:hypothetical protein